LYHVTHYSSDKLR